MLWDIHAFRNIFMLNKVLQNALINIFIFFILYTALSVDDAS